MRGFLASLAWDLEHQGSLGTALQVELWTLLSVAKQSTSPAGPPAMWKALGASGQNLEIFLSAFPGQGTKMNLNLAVKLGAALAFRVSPGLVTCVFLPCSGGSDPWRAHGRDPESHGESLPPRLV